MGADDRQLMQVVVEQQVQRLDGPQHRNELIEAAGDLVEQTDFDFVQVQGHLVLRLLQLLPRPVEQAEVQGRLLGMFYEVLARNHLVAFLEQGHVDGVVGGGAGGRPLPAFESVHVVLGDALEIVFELAGVRDLPAPLHLGAARLGAQVVVVLHVGFARPEEADEPAQSALYVLLFH